jgi:hypothetical protein
MMAEADDAQRKHAAVCVDLSAKSHTQRFIKRHARTISRLKFIPWRESPASCSLSLHAAAAPRLQRVCNNEPAAVEQPILLSTAACDCLCCNIS